jgi:hypothetical protein
MGTEAIPSAVTNGLAQLAVRSRAAATLL